MKLVRAMQAGAATVSLTVQDMHDAKKTLHAEFTTSNSSAALAKLLK